MRGLPRDERPRVLLQDHERNSTGRTCRL